MKSIPITEKAKGNIPPSNDGVREPLLNVGPAGVYGDNETSDAASKPPSVGEDPDTHKKKDSPFKQGVKPKPAGETSGDILVQEDPEITSETTTESGDPSEGVTKWTKCCPGGATADGKSPVPGCEDYACKDAGDDFDPCSEIQCDGKKVRKGNTCECETTTETKGCTDAQIAKGMTYNSETGKCEGTEPGDFSGATYKAKGDVMAPWESRQNIRFFKINKNRQQNSMNRVGNLENKLQKLYGENTPKPGEKGYARYISLSNKLKNAQQSVDMYQQGMNNAQRQQQQNLNAQSKQGVTGVNTSGQYHTQITGSEIGDEITPTELEDKIKYTSKSPAPKRSNAPFKQRSGLKKGFFKSKI